MNLWCSRKVKYKGHMLNEICEQPKRFEVLYRYLFEKSPLIVEEILKSNVENITLVGCGTSYYSALAGEYYLERFTKIRAKALPSSEFLFNNRNQRSTKTLLVALSRSGETTETVNALKSAKKKGYITLAVTNEPKSTLSKEADFMFETKAGIERSVVMTKTFNTQVMVLQYLSGNIGKKQKISSAGRLVSDLRDLSKLARQVVEESREKIMDLMEYFKKYDHIIYLASGVDYPIALEGALKIRETSYIASEAYYPMEFRHGPMAMVDKDLAVTHLIPDGLAAEEQLKVACEIREKNGSNLIISNFRPALEEFEYKVELPEIRNRMISPILFEIPLQLFAYDYCTSRKLDPDRPRSLAKVIILKKS